MDDTVKLLLDKKRSSKSIRANKQSEWKMLPSAPTPNPLAKRVRSLSIIVCI